MSEPIETGQSGSLSDYLAAERTLLAWVRTGLTLMGFGFVVARFGLFLQQLRAVQGVPPMPGYRSSLWFGVALIIASVMVNLLAGWHHLRLVRAINPGQKGQPHSTIFAVSLTLFIALVGLAMAVYLVSAGGPAYLQSESGKESSMALARNNGIIDTPSSHSVDQTVEKLKNILQSKGISLFALVDHSGEAEKVGMKMPPTKLLIFGNPKAGTPLMLAAPSVAIDLPLKILVWEDAQGKVWLSYNSPEHLKQRHGLPQELLQNIAVAGTLATEAGK